MSEDVCHGKTMKMKECDSELDVWDPRSPIERSSYYHEGKPILFTPEMPLSSSKPTMLDLFSGAGGISAGFEMAGFQAACGIDIHTPSIMSYRKNHQQAAAILGDIQKLSTGQVLKILPTKNINVVTGGVPCQGFSISNRKRWVDDERNFLFKEFIRIAGSLNPEVLIIENVSGMKSAKGGAFVDGISEAMANLCDGYDVDYRMLCAADYGVPQKRNRLLFLGIRSDLCLSASALWPAVTHAEVTDVPGLFGECLPPYVTVSEAFSGLPPLLSGEDSTHYVSGSLSNYAKQMKGDEKKLTCHRAPKGTESTRKRIAATRPGEPLYPAFKQRIRLHPEYPSPTIISGGIRPQFLHGHPTQARGLTIRERARLMSFPDSFVFEGGLVMGRVQTGQAVPPLLAKALAANLMANIFCQ